MTLQNHAINHEAPCGVHHARLQRKMAPKLRFFLISCERAAAASQSRTGCAREEACGFAQRKQILPRFLALPMNITVRRFSPKGLSTKRGLTNRLHFLICGVLPPLPYLTELIAPFFLRFKRLRTSRFVRVILAKLGQSHSPWLRIFDLQPLSKL